MDLYDEIAKVAYELYERDGRIHGRDLDHWLEAEIIVKSRDIEEQTPMILPGKKKTVKAKQKKVTKKVPAKTASRKKKAN